MIHEKQQIRLSVLSLWVGILIPIVAVLIPLAVRYLSPEHKLEYEVTGPIQVEGLTALRVEIRNQGEKVEKNVKTWIKVDATAAVLAKLEGEKKSPPLIQVSSSAKYSLSRDGDHHVIEFGDIRPNEKVTASLLLRGSHYSLIGNRYAAEYFSIKSDDRVAQNAKSDTPSFLDFMYPFVFWMFVILMVLMGAYAIYYEYMMDPRKKEKYILDQIDKLKK